ncbi:membrane protein [Betaproteobacteria bacterium]|nr:membrane protein [Betaproteobacteria bacterium]GHU24220.1 membrane protein [Betaproteobacteria bacterium]
MRTQTTISVASLIALNLVMSKVAASLSLPVYLDSVGTIVAAAVLPWWAVLIVGASTSIGAGIIVHPAFFYYIGTQTTVALLAVAFVRMGALRKLWTAVLAGLAIAVCAVIVSAPVTVLVFGGVTLGATTAINAVLMATGQNIWQSVLGGSVLIESIDKVAACVIASIVLRRLPRSVISGSADA